jgi:hypothetical protein
MCNERKVGHTLTLERAAQGQRKKKCKARHGAHTCNPRYSGGRDQKDGSLRPALAKS